MTMIDSDHGGQPRMDLSRVRQEFDAYKHDATSIGVVGVGAIGSRLVEMLSCIGLIGERLHLYDPDTVDGSNISSQMYSKGHVDRPKVVASILNIAGKWCADPVHCATPHKMRVSSKNDVRHDVVITCLDSMVERRRVICDSVFLNGKTSYVMDARITATTIFAIGFDPRDPVTYRQYKDEMYDDPSPEQDAAMGGCRITPSIASTASIAAGLLVQLLMNHLNKVENNPNEILVDLRTWRMEARTFAKVGR